MLTINNALDVDGFNAWASSFPCWWRGINNVLHETSSPFRFYMVVMQYLMVIPAAI
jgi:hypothetical protein